MCVATLYVSGLKEIDSECPGSEESDTGRFTVTFDATDAVRNSPNLDGELTGPVSGSVYRDEDVSILGPNDGAQPVASFAFPDVDLRNGVDGPYVIETELPAGDYQFLGFMDTDGNASATDGPDLNDPVMIPSRATALSCAEQPVTVTFPLLLPER